ncbi:MAG: hypothetical protein NT076_00500 [Candidatus Pacearchaeota archaeon]|nr:hypothetical protein [Candidatus Pacearchaeota archaeon]
MSPFIVKRVTESSDLWRIVFENSRKSLLIEKERVVRKIRGGEEPCTPEPEDVFDYDGKNLVLNYDITNMLYQIRHDMDI